MTEVNTEAVKAEAERRMHNDPVFHARVYTAEGIVSVEYHELTGMRLDEHGRALARWAASYALVVAEHTQEADRG